MTRIGSIDTIRLRIPFDDLYDGPRQAARGWTHFDSLLIRIETDDGLIGWGEAFAYDCAGAVQAAVEEMLAPRLIGQSIEDVAVLNRDLQQKLHIQGRYGITLFALSGIDIALWDLAAKRRGVSLSHLLGGHKRDSVPAYASLVRYGEAEPVRCVAAAAVADGYRDVKLHEIAYGPIAAGREAVGPSVRLATDVNCHWSREEAEMILPKLKALDLFWVEEPVFPPEDYDTLAALGRHGVALSAGENACTAVEFKRLIAAVTYPQPSVIKLGGVSEFLLVVEVAAAVGKTPMPHSPYFGPGYWTTLQLAAHLPQVGLFEFLYVRPEAWMARNIPLPKDGRIAIPDTPGIGFTPDEDVLARYRAERR